MVTARVGAACESETFHAAARGVSMAYDEDVAERVWAETCMLAPAPPAGADALARLQAALGRIAGRLAAGADRDRAFPNLKDAPKSNSPPPRGEAAYKAMALAIQQGEGGAYAGSDLPGALALVKLTASGKPDEPTAARKSWLPGAIAAGLEPVATFTRGDDPSGRVYGLYERVAAAGAGESPWISDVTSVGQPPPVVRKKWKILLAWALVGLGALFVLWSAVSLVREGASLARAYEIFAGTDREGAEKLNTTISSYCQNNAAATPCGKDLKAYLAFPPENAQTQANDGETLKIRGKPCLTQIPQPLPPPPDQTGEISATVTGVTKLFATGQKPPSRYAVDANCALAWRYVRAFDAQALQPTFPTEPKPQTISFVQPLLGMMAAMVVVGWAVGLGAYRRLFGLWINGQYRFSLSSAQISLWTILVVAPFATITLLQNALLAPQLRLSDTLSFSPEIPGLLYALMGITFTSTVLAKYILAVKNASADEPESTGVTRAGQLIANSEGLIKNADPDKASPMDFFLGEEEVDRGKLDISRFQNVLMTLVLVASYAVALVQMMGSVQPAVILGALATPQPLFPQLPTITGSFLALLMVSHAAYLISKASKKGPDI